MSVHQWPSGKVARWQSQKNPWFRNQYLPPFIFQPLSYVATVRTHLVILPFLVVVIILAGCGQKSTTGPTPLRVWHSLTDREKAFQALANRYEQETGISVRFELYAPTDVYEQKVRSAAQINGLPEIYSIHSGEMRELASFIAAGHVLSLEEDMNRDNGAWRSSFFSKALAVNMLKPNNPFGVIPGVYGVPLDVMNVQIFYNKKLLAKLGKDPKMPPRKWEDFLAIGPQAAEHNLIGFVSGWAELWLIECFATNYAIHQMGMEKVEATYRGDVLYTDPDWMQVFELFAQLRDSQLLAQGIVSLGNKQAEQLFANERAVFAFNGTWGVNVYRGMNPDLEYGVMMPPIRIWGRPMVTWGGAGASFVVNAQSARRDEAVAFLRWLTGEPQQRELMEATHNIPANLLAAAGLPAELAAFADDMDATVHPRLFSQQEGSTVIEAFNKGIQSILIGEATPRQIAERLNELKGREAKRQAALQGANVHN